MLKKRNKAILKVGKIEQYRNGDTLAAARLSPKSLGSSSRTASHLRIPTSAFTYEVTDVFPQGLDT